MCACVCNDACGEKTIDGYKRKKLFGLDEGLLPKGKRLLLNLAIPLERDAVLLLCSLDLAILRTVKMSKCRVLSKVRHESFGLLGGGSFD